MSLATFERTLAHLRSKQVLKGNAPIHTVVFDTKKSADALLRKAVKTERLERRIFAVVRGLSCKLLLSPFDRSLSLSKLSQVGTV